MRCSLHESHAADDSALQAVRRRPVWLCEAIAISGTSDQFCWLAEACGILLFLQIFGLPENSNAMIAAARVHSVLASEDLFVDPESADLPQDETLNSLTQLYSWGSGHNGRLGLGYQQDMDVPEMVSELDGTEILDVACGHDHTLVLIRL